MAEQSLPVRIVNGGLSSSATSGGNTTYSNVYGDFVATANNGAKTITLSSYASSTLSGSLGAKNFATAIIQKIDSAGAVSSIPTTSVVFAANVLTLADMTANFSTGDTVAVFVSGPDKGFAGIASTFDSISAKLAFDAIMNGSTELPLKRAFANIAASQTDSSLVAAVTSKKLVVVAMISLCGSTATALTFNTKPAGAGTAITPQFQNGANGGEVLPFNPTGWFATNAGEGLTGTTGAGSTTGVLVEYVEV